MNVILIKPRPDIEVQAFEVSHGRRQKSKGGGQNERGRDGVRWKSECVLFRILEKENGCRLIF